MILCNEDKYIVEKIDIFSCEYLIAYSDVGGWLYVYSMTAEKYHPRHIFNYYIQTRSIDPVGLNCYQGSLSWKAGFYVVNWGYNIILDRNMFSGMVKSAIRDYGYIQRFDLEVVNKLREIDRSVIDFFHFLTMRVKSLVTLL
jgi:hypothetical protein